MTEQADIKQTPMHNSIATEFLVWLWWITEREGGSLHLTDHVDRFPAALGMVDLYVGEKLSMSSIDSSSTVVRFSTDFSSARPALSALSSNWLPVEIELHARREDREYTFSLRAPELHIKSAKLPPTYDDDDEGAVYERMGAIDELDWIIRAAFMRFIHCRTSDQWPLYLRCIRQWVAGGIVDINIQGMTCPMKVIAHQQTSEQTSGEEAIVVSVESRPAPSGEE